MNLTKKTAGDALTIALEGRLDTTTAPELEKELKNSMDDVEKLTMDLNNLEYISSAGLRVLLMAHKTSIKPMSQFEQVFSHHQIFGHNVQPLICSVYFRHNRLCYCFCVQKY